MTKILKRIHELKVGDIVKEHGGTFRVIENAREAGFARPMSAHLTYAAGPSACAVAKSVCIDGCIPGYFQPGSEWTFQGNFLAPRCVVIVE